MQGWNGLLAAWEVQELVGFFDHNIKEEILQGGYKDGDYVAVRNCGAFPAARISSNMRAESCIQATAESAARRMCGLLILKTRSARPDERADLYNILEVFEVYDLILAERELLRVKLDLCHKVVNVDEICLHAGAEVGGDLAFVAEV